MSFVFLHNTKNNNSKQHKFVSQFLYIRSIPFGGKVLCLGNHKAVIKVLSRLSSHLEAVGENPLPRPITDGKNFIPFNCFTETSVFLLATSQGPQSALRYVTLHATCPFHLQVNNSTPNLYHSS